MAVSKRNEIPFTDLSIIKFAKELDQRFRCPICKRPLNNPVQTECGHRFCSRCLQDVISKPNAKCPLDDEPLTNGAFKDVCCRREIDSLFCYCLNKVHGCKWEKELMYLKDHLANCEYQEVPCPNGCEQKVPKIKLNHHKNEVCKFKPSRCQHCGQVVPEVRIEAHLLKCPKFPMTCERCGTTNIARDEMDQHLEKECAESEKPCKFRYAGCAFKAKDDIMSEHDQSQKTEHLNLMLEYSRKRDEKEIHLAQKLEKVEQENSSLKSQLSSHRETLAATNQDLRSYQTRLGKVEQSVAESRRDLAQLREKIPESASAAYGKNNDVSAQFEEFRSALVQQELKLSELETLSRASLSSTLAGGPRSLSGGSVSLERRLGRNEHQLALHDIQLAEHDLKIQMLEATSYDGTYIWKIDEFSRRQHDAIIGKTPSLYSPPFYVGRYGYKACARVYPNGDGMGKGTHLSLFFVIMRGEYDALLPWPFRQKVTFKLLDHDRQNDVTDTFRPDPNSSSFKRPTSSMNIASGCPIFVTLQDLQKRAYVNDDTLFIKVMVDTAGLPSLGFQ